MYRSPQVVIPRRGLVGGQNPDAYKFLRYKYKVYIYHFVFVSKSRQKIE